MNDKAKTNNNPPFSHLDNFITCLETWDLARQALQRAELSGSTEEREATALAEWQARQDVDAAKHNGGAEILWQLRQARELFPDVFWEVTQEEFSQVLTRLDVLETIVASITGVAQ